MSNIFAVYSKKKIFPVKKLTSAAKKQGIELRFMGIGGCGFHQEGVSQEYFDASIEDGLVIGALESNVDALIQFDTAAAKATPSP